MVGHEVTLVESTLAACVVDQQPELYDWAQSLTIAIDEMCVADKGHDLIMPHRRSWRSQTRKMDTAPLLQASLEGRTTYSLVTELSMGNCALWVLP